MPPVDAPPVTRSVVLRGLGFALAIALGAVAVWLIVIADTTKSMRLGVLAGIWGALLGAYSMFGARRHGLEIEQAPTAVAEAAPSELAVRSANEVERVAEAAARRAFEERLEQMLRRELARELADVRNEITQLRRDLLEKVGGQLRLERIETTRVIGSDLEALQHEVRQLKHASETGMLHDLGLGESPLRPVVEPARVRPVSRVAAEAQADVRPARSVDELAAAAAVVVPEAAEPEPAAEPKPAAKPEPAAQPERAAKPEPAVEQTTAPEAVAEREPEPATTPEPAVEEINAPEPAKAAEPEPSAPPVVPAASSWSPPPAHSPANGSGQAGARRPPVPAPTETTGPIQLPPTPRQQPTRRLAPDTGRAEPPARPAEPPARPAEPPARHRGKQEVTSWSPPVPPPPAEPAPAATAPLRPAEPARPAATSSGDDPFASLPRITPFTEFELDPIEPEVAASGNGSAADRPSPSNGHHANGAGVSTGGAYTGRRRRDGEIEDDTGRHSRSEAPPTAPQATGGGRRRRVDDDSGDENDLLTRLLARGAK